jgi:hypothetical protein
MMLLRYNGCSTHWHDALCCNIIFCRTACSVHVVYADLRTPGYATLARTACGSTQLVMPTCVLHSARPESCQLWKMFDHRKHLTTSDGQQSSPQGVKSYITLRTVSPNAMLVPRTCLVHCASPGRRACPPTRATARPEQSSQRTGHYTENYFSSHPHAWSTAPGLSPASCGALTSSSQARTCEGNESEDNRQVVLCTTDFLSYPPAWSLRQP